MLVAAAAAVCSVDGVCRSCGGGRMQSRGRNYMGVCRFPAGMAFVLGWLTRIETGWLEEEEAAVQRV